MSQLLKEDTIFEKAMKKYNYFTDNKDLLNEYDRRESYLIYQDSLMWGAKKDDFDEGIQKGIKKGKLEGIRDEKYSIAKTLKQMKMDDASISEITGLSIEEIRNLRLDEEKL